MVRITFWRFSCCRYAAFVAAFTFANLLLFGGPLYSFAASTTRVVSWTGLLDLVVLTALHATLMVMSLTAVSILSLRAMKAVCIAMLVGNAIALYFINTYNVVLDKSMMGNVFDTNPREAFDLFDPGLIAYVLLLAVLPSWFVLRTVIVDSSRLRRLRLLALTGALGCFVVYTGSSTWLWFDQQAKHLGGLMLPWAYIANTVRHFEDRVAASSKQVPLPPLHFVAGSSRERKTVVVLVIGESARAGDFSLYGYGRDTNPELTKAGVIALPDAHACATYTTAAIRCMLSYLGSSAPARVGRETLPNYLQHQGVEVIWRTNNWGQPPLEVAIYQRASDILRTCSGATCERLAYDEVLLYRLKEMLTSSASGRIFVVLHQAGSHGPTYYRRYPAEFNRFQPVCRSVDLSECSQESLLNAYDNTIVYTDHFLAETIKVLQGVPNSASAMIYISDHGESLGEHGFYLHGAPKSFAPDQQLEVPLLVWMSPAFRESRKVSADEMFAKAPFGDDNIFHSVLGAFGAHSPVYRPSLDLFRPTR